MLDCFVDTIFSFKVFFVLEISGIISGIIVLFAFLAFGVLFVKRKYKKKMKLKQLRQHQLMIASTRNRQQQEHQLLVPQPLHQLPLSNILVNFNEERNSLLDKASPIISITTSNTTKSSIRTENIELILEIAHGQFSKVWKSKFKQDILDIDVKKDASCAVKVFQSYEKHSWSNEKDIYSLLTDNDLILK